MPGARRDLDAQTWWIFGGLHRLLLRLAGRLPDELLTHARRMLGAGDLAYLPDTLTVPAAGFGVSMTSDDVLLLRNVVGWWGAGGEPQLVGQVPVSEVVPVTGHRFAPVSPQVLASTGVRFPASLDLSGGDFGELADLADDLMDLTDQVVVADLSGVDGVVRVRRAWRSGPEEASTVRRVFVVEVEPDVYAWDVAIETQRTLARLMRLRRRLRCAGPGCRFFRISGRRGMGRRCCGCVLRIGCGPVSRGPGPGRGRSSVGRSPLRGPVT